MILDAGLLFTGNFASTTYPAKYADNLTTGTVVSSFYIDLALGQTSAAGLAPFTGGLPIATQVPVGTGPNVQPSRDLGIGDDPALKILIQPIGTAFAGGTNVVVGLQGAQDNGSGAPTAFGTPWYSSSTVTLAALNQGQRIMDMDMPRPPAGIGVPRFLQLQFTIGGTFTGGNNWILGTLVLDRADQLYNATVNSTWGGYPAGITVAN
jgi:hypothetical protein